MSLKLVFIFALGRIWYKHISDRLNLGAEFHCFCSLCVASTDMQALDETWTWGWDCLWCSEHFSLLHLTPSGLFNQSYIITLKKEIPYLCLATVWSFTLIPPSPLGEESPQTKLSKWYDSSRLDHLLCLQEPCTGSALPFLLRLPSSILADPCHCGLWHWNHG